MSMRRLLPLTALVALSACGGGGGGGYESTSSGQDRNASAEVAHDSAATDASASGRTAAGPNIGVSAAPGVAFDYRYAFRLPSERISAVQEQHAQACEKLGLSRCRIIGFRYRLIRDDEIEAMLAFKVAPSIARQFGKSGADLVDRSEGMLVDAEINGTDAGAAIAQANRTEAELNEELQQVERQLARGGIPAYERARLQSEAQILRQQIRSNRAGRSANQESLATTPMAFHYGSGELIPGFDTRSPIRAALEQAWDNLIGGVATLLLILITLLPWAALALFGWWLARKLRPRWHAIGTGQDPASASA
jgi:hypothetical protein